MMMYDKYELVHNTCIEKFPTIVTQPPETAHWVFLLQDCQDDFLQNNHIPLRYNQQNKPYSAISKDSGAWLL